MNLTIFQIISCLERSFDPFANLVANEILTKDHSRMKKYKGPFFGKLGEIFERKLLLRVLKDDFEGLVLGEKEKI